MRRESRKKKVDQKGILEGWLHSNGTLGLFSCAWLPEILKYFNDKKWDQIINDAEKKYGLRETATAQGEEAQRQITGDLYQAAGVIALDENKSGCSFTVIDRDTENPDIFVLLTANHCVNKKFDKIVINQPHKTEAEKITIQKGLLSVSRHTTKDLAVIAVNHPQLGEKMKTASYQVGYVPDDNELCAMAFPALNGEEVLNTGLAVKTRWDQNWLGRKIVKNGLYRTTSSAWGGESGSGMGICTDTKKVIGVLVAHDIFDGGKAFVELLDHEIDLMILQAKNNLSR